MLCLGVESTAHTFGIGIVNEEGKILSNELSTYKPEKGGIVPNEAAEHHRTVKEEILRKALEKAGIELEDIDLIAVALGPGLPPCLLEGFKFALELKRKTKKPLLGVNHCQAHIEIGKLINRIEEPIVLYCSGANTQVIDNREGKYYILGETEDIGIGNAIDKLGRLLDIPFPAGEKIEELAKNGSWIPLPYSIKGMDVCFSGILAECRRKLKAGIKKADICFSFQEVAFSMLCEVVERALAFSEKDKVLIVGGVGANQRLKEMVEIMCKERGAKAFYVPPELVRDNGAMIAWTGILNYLQKKFLEPKDIKPDWRVDEI